MNRSNLKNLSKSQLKGHFKVPVLLTLIYTVVLFAVSITQDYSYSGIVSFLALLVTLGIEVVGVVGFPNFYLKFIKNNDDIGFIDFIASKNVLLKSLCYVILLALMGFVLGIVMGFVLIASVSYSIMAYVSFTAINIVLILVMIAIGIVMTIFSISIAMTPYILVDKNDIKAFESIKLSMKMMKGHKWEFFVLYLSFIGWAILCILTLGIGFLWLMPYMSLTYTNFYKELDRKYNKSQEVSQY